MARPLRLHVPGMLYHVIARGNNKERIYRDTRDFDSFPACRLISSPDLELLGKGLERFSVQCLAYCLMHTHYHLVLKAGPHPVSRLMQQVNSSYCQRFNRRHERVGHVLQGRFGSRMVEDGFYARIVLRYLALNPVEAKLVPDPEQWPWSSYGEAMRPTEESPRFLSLGDVWGVFGAADEKTGRELFAEFVRAARVDEYLNQGLVLGSGELARFISPRVAAHRGDTELVRAERFAVRPSLADTFRGIASEPERNRAASLAHLQHGYTLKEIAAIFSRHPTTIARWIRRAQAAE